MVRIACILGLVAAAGLMPVDAGARSPRVDGDMAAARPSDAAIAGAVQLELMLQDGVRASDVRVRVRNGVVLLHGSVDDALAAERAVEIARCVLGVRAVVDTIEVDAPERTDAGLLGAIRTAWALDPATETYQIDARVSGGAVVLTGTVESAVERRMAELIAKGVTGVRQVRNDIAVKPVDNRSDIEVFDDVRANLHWDILVDAADVVVAVDHGIVTLTGTVPTDEERERAARMAWTEGTRQVTNLLTVAPKGPPRALRSAEPVVLDEDLASAVREALRQDPRVLSDSIRIEVQGGTVRLSGIVERASALRAAEQDALGTIGVQRVESALTVREPRLAESERGS